MRRSRRSHLKGLSEFTQGRSVVLRGTTTRRLGMMCEHLEHSANGVWLSKFGGFMITSRYDTGYDNTVDGAPCSSPPRVIHQIVTPRCSSLIFSAALVTMLPAATSRLALSICVRPTDPPLSCWSYRWPPGFPVLSTLDHFATMAQAVPSHLPARP